MSHFKRAIDAGKLEAIERLLRDKPTLATELIAWGPLFRKCQTEPLHYLSDAPFNQLWNHGQQANIARLLLSAGAPADGLPSSGESPLHGAASLGEPEIAATLIEFGANIEIKASYPGIPDGTPLDFAVHFGIVDVLNVLVKHGAHIYSARMAAGAGLLELMIEKLDGADISDVFRCACVCSQIKIVDHLLQDGLDVNIDIEGASALHWAAWEAKPRMVSYLVEHGADRTRLDAKYKMTAAQWAAHRKKQIGPRWGHDAVIKILEQSTPS